jgi:uncharacterized protein YutE (UPF0331/DUF86 family)
MLDGCAINSRPARFATVPPKYRLSLAQGAKKIYSALGNLDFFMQSEHLQDAQKKRAQNSLNLMIDIVSHCAIVK